MAAAQDAAPGDLTALRDDARLVLERNCAGCHTAAYDTAVPEALAVFDLGEADWAARLTPAAIESIDYRLGGEGQGRGPDGPIDITPDELALVRAYLAMLAPAQQDSERHSQNVE